MQVYAIQTGTVAIKERQRCGVGSDFTRPLNTLLDSHWTDFLPIYVWVIEHPEGLIVIDTGETAQATAPSYFPRWNPYFRFGVRECVQPSDEIGPQLQAKGLSPNDVRWVVLTHLHTDHAGGLHHFPHAEILLSRTEYDGSPGLGGQLRGVLPQHWPSWFAPRLVLFNGQSIGPFRHSHRLTQAGDVLLVPTPGHTRGHLSVVVKDGDSTLFFAGDASYTEQLLLAGAVDGVSPNGLVAQKTLQRIQQFVQMTPTVYLPSHDPASASRLAARQPTLVATA